MRWILQDIPVGKNIQRVRLEKKMTQTDLVVKLQLMVSNTSRSTLANIETGRRNIKASDLKCLHIILEVDLIEFFEEKN